MRLSRYVAQAGLIAAVYGTLSVVVIQNPWGFGPVQFRVSESLTVVALFTPAAVPGLWLGTVFANLFMLPAFGPVALLDVVFGGLGTLLGAAWTWHFRPRRALALAGPVISNALIVPAYLPVILAGMGFYSVPVFGWDLEGHYLAMYVFGVASVGIGQAVVVYGLGLPLAKFLERHARAWSSGG
ncbi:MAG: QueT transporter family protein [Coriobacteriia bacterium]